MSRLRSFQLEGAQILRDEAREYIGELFPKARVSINFATIDNQLGVAARIIGDTAPHPVAEIVDCLEQLGVCSVEFVEPETTKRGY